MKKTYQNRKNILLIFPSKKYPSYDIPWGIVNIASSIKENIKDAHVDIIDLGMGERLSGVKSQLRGSKPDIIGIYMDTLMYNDGLSIANIAKEYNCQTIIGGPHPTIMPESVIKNEGVDAICVGEGDKAILDYIEHVYYGKDLPDNCGIWLKKEKEIIKNDKISTRVNLEEIASPDLNLLNMEGYIKRWIHMDSCNPKLRGISLIVSRGCPFSCAFCQPTLDKMFGKKPRIKPVKKVIEEIKKWEKDYNLQAVYFQDDTLTIFKDWLYEFCETLIKDKIGLIWSCNTRADTVGVDLLKVMKASGCVKVKVGIECNSDRIRNSVYKKQIDYDQIVDFLEMAGNLGIQTAGFFMLGGPTESIKEVIETVNFAVNSSLIEASFTISTPLLGSYLYNTAVENKWKLPNNFSGYDYYKTGFIEREINKYILGTIKKYAYLSFYLSKARRNKTLRIVFSDPFLIKSMLKLKTYF